MHTDLIAPAAATSHDATASATTSSRAARLVAAAGVAWNGFGALQFLHAVRSTPESLRQMGMTAEQADAYASYPAWMTLAFAVGVWGGLGGCLLLLARRRWAVPVLAGSLIGYLVLYAGDITEGVFKALGGSQVAVLTAVVVIAAGLLVWSRRMDRRGALT